MATPLLRTVFLTALSAFSMNGYGQEPANSPRQPQPEPFFIVNSTVLVNASATQIDPKNIKSLVVYKQPSADTPELLRSLAPAGIIAITYDGKIAGKSFAQLARQRGARGPLRVVVNGYRLSAAQAATLRVAPGAIEQLQVFPAPPDSAATTVTIQLAPSKPSPHPPGTIMLR